MSTIAIENKEVINIENTENLKEKLIRLNDIKFLTEIGIMATINVMLMTWQPMIEIPIVIGALLFDIIFTKYIKRFKIKNNLL